MGITSEESQEDYTLDNLNQTSMPLAWSSRLKNTNAILQTGKSDPELLKKVEQPERQPRKPINMSVSVPQKVKRYLVDRNASEGSEVASESGQVWLDSLGE